MCNINDMYLTLHIYILPELKWQWYISSLLNHDPSECDYIVPQFLIYTMITLWGPAPQQIFMFGARYFRPIINKRLLFSNHEPFLLHIKAGSVNHYNNNYVWRYLIFILYYITYSTEKDLPIKLSRIKLPVL